MMNAEVIIVGGGLSGLYAARLLEKAGIDYALLEGRERMGGRILQANAAEADLGATWFWPTFRVKRLRRLRSSIRQEQLLRPILMPLPHLFMPMSLRVKSSARSPGNRNGPTAPERAGMRTPGRIMWSAGTPVKQHRQNCWPCSLLTPVTRN